MPVSVEVEISSSCLIAGSSISSLGRIGKVRESTSLPCASVTGDIAFGLWEVEIWSDRGMRVAERLCEFLF